MKLLILPGDPEFDYTLGASLPPAWQTLPVNESGGRAFVARAGSGLLEPATDSEVEEYFEGGEYEQRLNELGDEELLEDFYGGL